MAHAGGRPPLYTIELAAVICGRIADGESLSAICRDSYMPAMSTVMTWLDKPEFAERYARAKDKRLEVMSEEIQQICDDMVGDDKVKVQRDRLRVDTRKWLLSKLVPKTYGDRQTLEHSGPGQGPLEIRVVRVGREKP